MNFSQRSYKLELLDRDDIPFADIRLNMQELEMVNTRLGGHAITIKGLQKLVGGRKQIHICEIGCGGGDNLVALHTWCSKKGISARFTGIDIKPACIEVAKEKKLLPADTWWIISDYRTAQFQQQPDIIFSSLFCHHFTDEQLVTQLQWMHQHANLGFFINDLHRHVLAYYSIKFITRLFSKSYLVKNDAPLSVSRGFKKGDWQKLMQQAGITDYKISWQWAFRWLIASPSFPLLKRDAPV
jgi:2-polyprenyl-3-methyl-5-hydroxy-6-metoxy-1,4-benzoquinol methylase